MKKKPAKKQVKPAPKTSVLASMYVKKPKPPAPPVVSHKPAPPPPRPAPPAPVLAPLNDDGSQPLNTFREGQRVSIKGIPDMQNLRIERISPSGVTVSGGKLPPSTVLSGSSPATLMMIYERPATEDEPGLTVQAPAQGHETWSSSPGGGTVRHYTAKHKPLPPGHKPAPPAAPKAPKVAGPKREGVCAFIDNLVMQGGRTKEQILALVLAEFPDRDSAKTLTTIGIRPSHLRKAGQTPPPFKK